MSIFLNKKRKNKFDPCLYKFDGAIPTNSNIFSSDFSFDEIYSYHSEIDILCWHNTVENSNIKRLNDKEFENNKKFVQRPKQIKKNNNNIINNKNSTKDYIDHCIEMKKYEIKQIIEMNQIRNIAFKKYNLILDIDLTMIKAVELKDTTTQRKDGDIEIKGFVNNNQTQFQYFYRYRPYLFNFIKEIKDYFNFYISTLSHINYASKIINDFKYKTGIIIPSCRIISRNDQTMNTRKFKYINEIIPLSKKDELNNTIIIDDTIGHWIKSLKIDNNNKDTSQCIKCLIPSKRYIMDFPHPNEDGKYDILIHNNIYEKGYETTSNYSIEIDYSYCIEKDSAINTKNCQLYYIELFLKKCIKFSLFSGRPLIDVMNYYRRKIFENCKFNLKFLGNEWIYAITSIVKDLGGTIVISIDETTHFIIENKINSNKIYNKNNSQMYVNVNYIFQCYFNLYKFNELDKKFKAINSNFLSPVKNN